MDDDVYRLTVDIRRTGLSTEFSNLFRSFASLYNAVHEELEHRHPVKPAERLKVVDVEVHSPGHVTFQGVPHITQWVDILVTGANAAVGAAGLWLAFKAQGQAEERHRRQQLEQQQTLMSQQDLFVLSKGFMAEAAQMERDYGLSDRVDLPPHPGNDEEDADAQLTFDFSRSPWGELSPHDQKGIQAIQQIKSMQRRRLIAERRLDRS
ncbi:MAG: hypothetical protein M0Z36_03680 [Thermaerobacter sp.]|nr:hypothetical protein [Thermaerobacter sp.]